MQQQCQQCVGSVTLCGNIVWHIQRNLIFPLVGRRLFAAADIFLKSPIDCRLAKATRMHVIPSQGWMTIGRLVGDYKTSLVGSEKPQNTSNAWRACVHQHHVTCSGPSYTACLCDRVTRTKTHQLLYGLHNWGTSPAWPNWWQCTHSHHGSQLWWCGCEWRMSNARSAAFLLN